jgi:hypothetical protein
MAIEEEEAKLGPFERSLHKVVQEEVELSEFGEPIVFQPSLLHEPNPLNVQEGGFIAHYTLGSMTIEYLVKLREGCSERLQMAQHDLGAVTAELAVRNPNQIRIEPS